MKDRGLLMVLAAALVGRAVAAMVLPGDLLARTWEYEDVALNLLNGHGFVGYYGGTTYQALVHPVYPALCAFVYSLVGHSSLVAMQMVQAALVIPAGYLAFDLASRIAGTPWAGRIAAAGVTLHPGLMLFSLRRHALWIDAVIFLSALWAVFRAGERASAARHDAARHDAARAFTARDAVVLGAIFGLGILSRSTLAIFMAASCLWLVWRSNDRFAAARHAVLVMATASLIASPWLVRNAITFGRPIGMVSTSPYGLWIGNNPYATGGALAADGRDMEQTDPALLQAIRGSSEMEQQALYRDAAMAYITTHPWETVRNYGIKLRTFFFWSEQTGAWYPAEFRLLYQSFYVGLLLCGAIGAVRLVQAGHIATVILCAAFVLCLGLVQSVFFVEGRHRWEVESAIVVMAGCGVALAVRQPEAAVQWQS